MLIVMAGLPGTGKSTLAARLAEALGGVVLSKDVVRAAMFPPPVLDYSPEQNEGAMKAVYLAASYVFIFHPRCPVIIDGRTFSKPGQLDEARARAAQHSVPFRVIECVCSDEVALERIQKDHTAGTHLAGNRTPAMYARAKAAAVPLEVPRLTLDTGATPLEKCVRLAMEYLGG